MPCINLSKISTTFKMGNCAKKTGEFKTIICRSKFLDISTSKMEHHFLKFLEQKTNAYMMPTFENELTPFS